MILLVAFALRVYHLDTQSIWYDEGLSITLAQQPPAQAIALSAATDHPPLHTLLLGAWLAVAGDSDFAARYLSVFFGVLMVALTFALGRQVAKRAGSIAAGLMALSPFAVYYSQEARGYTLLTTLVLIATLAFARLRRGDRRRRIWLAYSAALSAALYTHYFAAFAWAAINVAYFADLTGFRKPVRSSVSWLTAQFIILAIFAPWLPKALAQAGSNATYFPGRVTWETVVGDTWRAFTVGEWGAASGVGWVWLALILIGLIGFAPRAIARLAQEFFSMCSRRFCAGKGFIQNRRKTAVKSQSTHSAFSVVRLLVALLIVPLVLMSGLAWLRPKFAPRYLLPSLPAFIALASVGIVKLIDGRRARYCQSASIGLAISLALPLASVVALWPLYTDPSLARPDVRSVVRYIEAHEASGDAIVLIGGHQAPAFNHYYRGQSAVIPMPPDLLPAVQSPLDARALTTLAAIAAQHARVWLVLWQNEISDPTNVALNALLDQAQRLTVGENFHAMSVLLFDVSAARFEILPQNPVDFAFTEPLRLVGYTVNSSRITIDTPLRFGLYLSSDAHVAGNYQIFTHVLTANGALITQADHIAGADSYPTSLWAPGSLIYNRFEMPLPADTPPGDYRVVVGLYEADRRLKLADGADQIELFTLTVEP